MLYEAPPLSTQVLVLTTHFFVDLVLNINLSHSLLTMLLTVELTTILKLYLVAICSEITYEIMNNLVLSTLFLQSAPSEW